MQRNKLHELQEQHSDLLGLLAQQEVELHVFKQRLYVVATDQYDKAEKEARRIATERYGAYVSFRSTDSDSQFQSAVL